MIQAEEALKICEEWHVLKTPHQCKIIPGAYSVTHTILLTEDKQAAQYRQAKL
jgi:hypothetical protein